MVMGASAGVGKSTFARRLGEKLDIEVYHLDTFYWKPGWVERSLEEFRLKQEQVVSQDQWIIEGNYSNTYDVRAPYADTIIYLELPLSVCLYRVFKRFFLNIGKNRPDMGEGCREKLDYKFIKFIITTYYPRKEKMRERIERFKEMDPNKKIVKLTSKKGIQSFLDRLP